MNIRLAGLVAGALAALSAFSLDVTLAPAGDIRFGDYKDCALRTLVALPGWQGLSSKGGWEIKKPGVAPFTLSKGDTVLLKAVATLDQLPEGKVRISYSFTPVEDVDLVVLGSTLTQPAGPVTGKPWKMTKKKGPLNQAP